MSTQLRQCLPDGFFFCNRVIDSGIIIGFFDCQNNQVYGPWTLTATDSDQDFLSIVGSLMRSTGFVGLGEAGIANPIKSATALFETVSLESSRYLAHQLTGKDAFLYFAHCACLCCAFPKSMTLRRNRYSTSDYFVGQYQWAVTGHRLATQEPGTSYLYATGSSKHDVALILGILNNLYPAYTTPVAYGVDGSVFEAIIPSSNSDGVIVPLFTSQNNRFQTDANIVDGVLAGDVLGIAWNGSNQSWYSYNPWFAESTPMIGCAMRRTDVSVSDLIAAISSSDTSAIESGILAISDQLTTLISDVGGVSTDVSGVSDQVSGLSSDVGGVSTQIGSLATGVTEAERAILDAIGGIDVDLSPIEAQLNQVLAQSSVDSQIVAAMVVKVAIGKLPKKLRSTLLNALRGMRYDQGALPDYAGQYGGAINLYDMLFDSNGKPTFTQEAPNGSDTQH